MQKSYCYTPGVGVRVSVRVGVHMQNVRANVKVLEFKSFCIFSCILTLLIILIKPLTTKAYHRRASGDCGTSGFLGHRSQGLQWPIVITRCLSSVVRLSSVRQFTFSTSSPEPLDGFWWNLVGMKYSRSLTSVVVFQPDPPRGGSRARP